MMLPDDTSSDWNDEDGERGAVSGWDVGDGNGSIGTFPADGASANDATDAASANDAAAAATNAAATNAAAPNEVGGDPDFGPTTPSSSSFSIFDRLPNSVVVRIFWFLPLRDKVGVELVAKRWQTLSRLSWPSITDFSLLDFPALRTMDDRLFSRLGGGGVGSCLEGVGWKLL